MKQQKAIFFNEFTVLGIFVASILIGLTFGLVFWLSAQSSSADMIKHENRVPTVIEYRTDVASVMTPFLVQAESIKTNKVTDDAGEAIIDLANLTQDRLLRMRVPGSEREAHLSFVILLDQWKQAVKSGGDLVGVLQRTQKITDEHRWILPE